jgi:hypothetical protein
MTPTRRFSTGWRHPSKTEHVDGMTDFFTANVQLSPALGDGLTTNDGDAVFTVRRCGDTKHFTAPVSA